MRLPNNAGPIRTSDDLPGTLAPRLWRRLRTSAFSFYEHQARLQYFRNSKWRTDILSSDKQATIYAADNAFTYPSHLRHAHLTKVGKHHVHGLAAATATAIVQIFSCYWCCTALSRLNGALWIPQSSCGLEWLSCLAANLPEVLLQAKRGSARQTPAWCQPFLIKRHTDDLAGVNIPTNE